MSKPQSREPQKLIEFKAREIAEKIGSGHSFTDYHARKMGITNSDDMINYVQNIIERSDNLSYNAPDGRSLIINERRKAVVWMGTGYFRGTDVLKDYSESDYGTCYELKKNQDAKKVFDKKVKDEEERRENDKKK